MKQNSEAEFIINLHQTTNGGEEIGRLLKEEGSIATIAQPAQTLNTSSASKTTTTTTTTTKTGPQLIEEKFPEIHDVATEFIKRNGYKAQEKRRNDDFVSCGVSVQEVREHLLKTIPGLAEHGLSKTSVKYLFKPVHQGR